MGNFKKEEFSECPVCKKKTFLYDSEIKANRCHDGFCGWTDQVLPAIDVPKWFLEYCYQKAEPGPKKDLIKKIVEETEKINKEYQIQQAH